MSDGAKAERELYSSVLDELERLEDLLELGAIGLDHAASSREIHEVMLDISRRYRERHEGLDPGSREERSRRRERLEKFGKQEQAEGFPFLNSLATVWLHALMDSFVLDLAAVRLCHIPALLQNRRFQRVKGRIAELLRLPLQDQSRYLVDRMRQDISMEQAGGQHRWDAVAEAVGLGGEIPRAVREPLDWMVEVRNSFVHQGGRADRRVIERCPELALELGARIKVRRRLLRIWQLASRWYVLELSRRTPRDAGENPEAHEHSMELHEAALKSLVELIEATRARYREDLIGPTGPSGESSGADPETG